MEIAGIIGVLLNVVTRGNGRLESAQQQQQGCSQNLLHKPV
jgi:hypothetical protein